MPKPERLLLLLLFLILAAGVVSVNDALLYTPDSARYLIWAQSLAGFDGFNDFTLPDPTRYVVHAPLYPILLTPAALIAPGSVVAAKVTNLLMAFLAAWLLFRWLRRAVGDVVAGWAAGFFALNGLTLLYSTQVLSEIPFAIAVMAAVMLVEDMEEIHEGHTAADMAGIILALTAAMFLREIGVTVVAAFMFLWFIRRQWRAAMWVGGACLLLYVLWFVRNEVIVAGLEQPPLRNSHLLVAHLYTSQNESLVAELLARVATNLRTYAGHFPTLVFAPDLARLSHGLVDLSHGGVAWILTLVSYLSPVYLAVTLLLSGAGAVLGWAHTPSIRRALCIVALYAVPVLLYPINDIRFLYPVLLVLVYVGAVGAHELRTRWGIRMNRSVVRWSSVVAVLLAFVPHLVWAGSYYVNNWRFAHDREALQAEASTPDYYRKTLADAGRWVNDHVEPGATILSRWKEVALETPAQKVIDVDPQMTPDNFDRTIRDYNVRYVVSVVWQTGVRENETQIEYSSRYAFVPVHRVGTVEVLRVETRSFAAASMDTVRSDDDSLRVYRTALRLLRRGDPVVAESLLVSVERRMGRYASIVYQQAVARALAGKLDEAMTLFERVRSIPQAGSILQQAWYHQEIIARLRAAHAAPSVDERAKGFHLVAINYWELGFRGQAFRMIDSALGVQPRFFPALIFGAIFRYQDGSIDAAEALLTKAEKEQPMNPLVMTMQDVLKSERTRRASSSPEVQAAQWRLQARSFTGVEMREDAVDAWRGLLQVRPEDPEALRGLTILMGEKRRFGPALDYARRWAAAMPNDPQAAEAVADLERRWQ